MDWGQWADVAEVVAALGVMASLLFVGYQYRQTRHLLERGEQNTTMAEWSRIRLTIAQHREVAELWASLQDGRELDDADSLRLETLLEEHLWAGYHIWDRTRRNLFDHGRFEDTAGLTLGPLLRSARARGWWAAAKEDYPPPFVAEVDGIVAGRTGGQEGRAGAP